MKSFIIEDSRLARTELKKMLSLHHNIQLCGEAESPVEALPLINRERPELLFLDINMPGKTGFELLYELDYEPKIIFITAYAEHALRSFEFSTVDYLLKPVTEERLKIAIDKLIPSGDGVENRPDSLALTSRVFLRDGEKCYWVSLQNIRYLESIGNHTKVMWNEGNAMIFRTLVKIEERLPPDVFFRANRQQIINVDGIIAIEPWFNGGYKLKLDMGAEIEVSRRHAVRFKEMFSL